MSREPQEEPEWTPVVQDVFRYIAANAKALPLAKDRSEALNVIQNWLSMTSTTNVEDQR